MVTEFVGNTPEIPTSPRLCRLRLSVMMFFQWALFGLWIPVIGRFLLAPVAEGGLGFDNSQVGWILGASATIGAFLAPFLGGQIADRYIPTQRLMAVLLLISGALQWVTSYQTTFGAWLWLSIASASALAPLAALTNSLAFAHMTDPARQYPTVRLWGTIGWIVPAWVFPMVWLQTDLYFTWKPPFLVGSEHAETVPLLIDSLRASAVLAVVYAVYCFTLLPDTPPKRQAREPMAFRKAFRLFRRPSFAVLVLASLPITCIHQIYFIQTAPLLSSLGMRDADILPAMSVGQFAEIGMIAVLGLLLKRLGFRRVMAIGAGAYVLRFVAMGLPGLPLEVVVASLALHGVCFACFYAAGFIYVDRLADEDVRHSAQTMFGIVLGAGPVIGGWLNGVLAEAFTPAGGKLNYTAFWYVVAAVGLVATLVLAALFRDETKDVALTDQERATGETDA